MNENINWDIFCDEQSNIQFAERGYQILNIDSPEILEEISDLYQTVSSKYRSGLSITIQIPDTRHRKSIHEKISKILEPVIKHYFKSYHQICCGFLVKKSKAPEGEFPLHQDISMIQQGGRPALSLWLPLVPTCKVNGNLQVVPKSHLYYRHERAAGTPFPLLDREKELRAHYLKPLPTKYGQAIVFDHTLFHASPPNMSGTDRVVCVSALLPEEKPTFFYFRNEETVPVELEAYRVNDDFYLSCQPGFSRPMDILPDHSLTEAPPPASFSFFSTAFPKIN